MCNPKSFFTSSAAGSLNVGPSGLSKFQEIRQDTPPTITGNKYGANMEEFTYQPYSPTGLFSRNQITSAPRG